ncbi:MAG: hypothetical protein N2504_02255 [candidate division WOR-3 bacterium]|nr:hypothetical protein [candidate division WOR-3 bacterium]
MQELNIDICALDVIQSIQTTKTPLMIVIISEGNKADKVAKIFVHNKRIYHAEYENYYGVEALKRIISLPVKRAYIIKMDKLIEERTLNLKVDEALLNATFQNQKLPSFTTFINADGIVNEIKKIGSVIAIIYYFEDKKSEIFTIEYIDPNFIEKRVEIVSRVSEHIRKFGRLIENGEIFVLEREIVYFFYKTISAYLVVMGKSDIQIDLLRVVVKKII